MQWYFGPDPFLGLMIGLCQCSDLCLQIANILLAIWQFYGSPWHVNTEWVVQHSFGIKNYICAFAYSHFMILVPALTFLCCSSEFKWRGRTHTDLQSHINHVGSIPICKGQCPADLWSFCVAYIWVIWVAPIDPTPTNNLLLLILITWVQHNCVCTTAHKINKKCWSWPCILVAWAHTCALCLDWL